MRFSVLLVLLSFLPSLNAQLVTPTAIPKGPNVPVVFLNGYQSVCVGVTFSGTFGNADAVLAASGIPSVFFDNCSVFGRPTIEALGTAFGKFLGTLKYTDGTPVPQVDVVVHSMGGLIVRSYLAGKLDVTPTAYAPPATPGIRKAVFLATPHWGTALGSVLGFDIQTQELSLGSQFLFDLNTWNAGYDDLRGIDALAVAGTAGNETGIAGFDDGVVALTSASLGFVHTGRTRVVNACHTGGLLVTFGYCPANSTPIAQIDSAGSIVGQIVTSFLTGTNAWQSLGQALESVSAAANTGGIDVQVEDSTGIPQTITSAVATTAGRAVNLGLSSAKTAAYSEALPAGPNLPIALTGGAAFNVTPTIPIGTVLPLTVKAGPVVKGAVPGGSAVFPYAVTSGAFIAIYGSNLAGSSQQATSLPFPTQLADAQVFVNGVAVPLQFAGPGQINAIFPTFTGSTTIANIRVTNSAGSYTTNALVQPAVPSVFSLSGTGSGPAAAVNALTGAIIGTNTPLHAGDYVELFLTGLGATTTRGGLDYANNIPVVTLGGQTCSPQYAGRVFGVPALDQINCLIPSGITGPTVPVIVSAAGRVANTVTLNIQ